MPQYQDEDELDVGASVEYIREVGRRLRAARREERLSLHEVEEASGGEFKASILGAYERGERAISVYRLTRLARFYGAPVHRILPGGAAMAGVVDLRADEPSLLGGEPAEGAVTVDLNRLEDGDLRGAAVIRGYLEIIRLRRGTPEADVLTIRGQDLSALARAVGLRPDDLRRALIHELAR
jgi:transcriptional regulator with XRE-family HTH domain